MADLVVGTHESKRRQRALPDPLGPPISRVTTIGCLLTPWTVAGVGVLLYLGTHQWVPVAAAVVGLLLGTWLTTALLRSWIVDRRLLAKVRSEWTPRGVQCLVVHSNSEAWRDHIARFWLPRIGERAVLFNWSERASRRDSLEYGVFEWFCGERRNFNPAVVVFRGLQRPLVFRFYYAFLEVKAGRTRYLEEQERRMFEALGV